MIEGNIQNATTIFFQAELLMYGNDFLKLEKSEKGIVTSWMALADGAVVVSEGEKEIHEADFQTILDNLSKVEFPKEQRDEEKICWGILIANDKEETLFSLENGYWDRKCLDEIVEILNNGINDEEVMESIVELLQM